MGTEQPPVETVGMATATVDRGHERRDVRVGLLVAVGAGLIAVGAVIQVVLYFQVHGLWSLRQRELPAPAPVATALPAAPPEPRLQTAPALDLRALRTAEDAQLHGYGWIDRAAGIVHIPIDHAMALLAQEADRDRGPGASEQRSEQSERAAHGPPASSEADRGGSHAGRRGPGERGGAALELDRRARSARALDGPPASLDAQR